MKLSAVKKLPTYQRLRYWITERYNIFLKKGRGEKKPWTDDDILRTYRFCNVRRMDDKVSLWLMDHWYRPNFDHPNMLLAVALARFINNPNSLDYVGFPLEWKPGAIKARLREVKKQGLRVFNPAYMVRGNDGEDKIESVVDHNVSPLEKVGYPTGNMRDCYKELLGCYGLGSFMAGQITADLRWAVGGKWLDKGRWAPKGPGSMRGMNRLIGDKLDRKINQGSFVYELNKQVIEPLSGDLPKLLVARLEAHDYQNCLCEFDKYERALWGEGTPKQLYDGGGE